MIKSLILLFSSICIFQVSAQKQSEEKTQINPNDAYYKLLENSKSATCSPCYLELTELALKAGFYKKAIEHAKLKLLQDSLNITALYALSQAYQKRSNYKSAFKTAKQIVLINPESTLHQKRLAYLATKAQKPSDAITAYLAALNLNPNDEGAGYDLALLLYNLNLLDEAQHIAAQFINNNPDHLGLIALLSKINYKQKEYDLAIHWANLHITLQDTSLEMTKILAVSSVKIKQYETGLNWFQYLSEKDKMSEDLYYLKASAFDALGISDSALHNYEQALVAAQSPNEGLYHLSLGLLLDKNKDYKKAMEHYKKAYELSQDEIILYYLARASDIYYRDKQIALNYYQAYLETHDKDTSYSETMNYADHRISEIKTAAHLKLDTI